MPSASSQRSTPSTLTMIERTNITARLVAMRSKMRFMVYSPGGRLDCGGLAWFQDRPRALLGNDVGRRIGISRGDARHDRGVDHAQPLDAAHPQLVVDHRHRVAPHFAGAHGMENCSP